MSNKILEIQNLTVSFDGFKAINNLNFSLDEGELRVVIGPNGARKGTFTLKAKTSAPTLSIKFVGWALGGSFKRPASFKNSPRAKTWSFLAAVRKMSWRPCWGRPPQPSVAPSLVC
jgi:hypothetical protein